MVFQFQCRTTLEWEHPKLSVGIYTIPFWTA
jgi:hypothetical protein